MLEEGEHTREAAAAQAKRAREERVTSEPLIAQKGPYEVDVEAGQDYFWCRCGRSRQQPFCDGSHKGTGLVPLKFHAEVSETLYFCGCKHSHSPPCCDGTHNQLND